MMRACVRARVRACVRVRARARVRVSVCPCVRVSMPVFADVQLKAEVTAIDVGDISDSSVHLGLSCLVLPSRTCPVPGSLAPAELVRAVFSC